MRVSAYVRACDFMSRTPDLVSTEILGEDNTRFVFTFRIQDVEDLHDNNDGDLINS